MWPEGPNKDSAVTARGLATRQGMIVSLSWAFSPRMSPWTPGRARKGESGQWGGGWIGQRSEVPRKSCEEGRDQGTGVGTGVSWGQAHWVSGDLSAIVLFGKVALMKTPVTWNPLASGSPGTRSRLA